LRELRWVLLLLIYINAIYATLNLKQRLYFILSTAWGLGTASPNGSNSSPVHTPTFDIDETTLETASGFIAFLAVEEILG